MTRRADGEGTLSYANGSWVVRAVVDGKRHSRSLKGPYDQGTRRKANELLRRLLADPSSVPRTHQRRPTATVGRQRPSGPERARDAFDEPMERHARGPRRRYALHALEELLDWPTAEYLADLFGTTAVTVEKWRVRGLSHRQADHCAVAVNLHPVLIWPEWIDDQLHATAEDAAAEQRPRRPWDAWHHSRVHELATR